jgi:hypothetical protein
MKRLFDERDMWTDHALDLERSASSLLEPLVKEYLDAGYTSHDVELVLMNTVSIMLCKERLGRRFGAEDPR